MIIQYIINIEVNLLVIYILRIWLMHRRWDLLKYMNHLHQAINWRPGERSLMGTPNLP